MFTSQFNQPGKVQRNDGWWTLDGGNRLWNVVLTHTRTDSNGRKTHPWMAARYWWREHRRERHMCLLAAALITPTAITRSPLLSFDFMSYCRSLHLFNGSFLASPSLGGLLLHLLLLWFTSLETLALLLAQNGYQMHTAGIGVSWPQRTLSGYFHTWFSLPDDPCWQKRGVLIQQTLVATLLRDEWTASTVPLTLGKTSAAHTLYIMAWKYTSVAFWCDKFKPPILQCAEEQWFIIDVQDLKSTLAALFDKLVWEPLKSSVCLQTLFIRICCQTPLINIFAAHRAKIKEQIQC